MIGRVLILCVFVSVVSTRHSLFDPEEPIATESADVKLVAGWGSRAKRDGDDTDYHLTISTNGKEFHARLKRSDDTDFPIFNDGVPQNTEEQKDWAIYTSEDVDGHFVVAKRSAGLTIEGYLRQDGEAYLIQPASDDGGHVIHTIDKYEEERDPPVPLVSRVKRSSSGYVVEIYAIADKEMVSFVGKKMPGKDKDTIIKQYYAMHLAGMNRRFKSVSRYGMTISVRSIGLDIKRSSIPQVQRLESMYTQRWGEKKLVGSDKALDAFNTWIHAQRGIPKYDYAVLYTGYDLASGGKTSTAGIAFRGAVCGYNAVGVCEFSFSTSSIRTATHELGHDLGSRHTWVNGCPNDYTIMSYKNYEKSKKHQWWTFSSCSASDIKKHLSKAINSKCLKSTSSSAPKADAEFLGNTMTVDEQCILASKKNLGFARHRGTEGMCGSFRCLTEFNARTGSSRWSLENALPGTQCGNKKWCEAGRCVYNSLAPAMKDPKCPFGDDPKMCANIRGPMDCMSKLSVVKEKFCCNKCKVDPNNIRVVSAHTQCNKKYSGNLGFSHSLTTLSSMCTTLSCYVKFDTRGGRFSYSYNFLTPMDGTPCGDKKLCMNKRCVYNSRAPSMARRNCPSGENKYVCSVMPCGYKLTNCCSKCPK